MAKRMFLCLGVLLGTALAAGAQPADPPQPDSQPTPVEQSRAEKQRAAKDLEAAKDALKAVEAEGKKPSEALLTEIELLNRLELTCGQVLSATEHATELATRKQQAATDLDNLRTRGISEQPPYPFMMQENLGDQFDTEQGRAATLAEATQLAQQAVVRRREAAAAKERARRQAKEALDTNKDAAKAAQLGQALRQAELAARLAAQEVHLREIELANQTIEKDTHALRVTLLQEQLALVRSSTRFTAQGLQDIAIQLDEQEFRLNQALETARSDLAIRDTQWMEARARLDASATKEPRLVEEVEGRRLARHVRQREVALIGRQLQIIAGLRTLWTRRHAAFNRTTTLDELDQYANEARDTIEQLHRDSRLNSSRITELRQEAQDLESKLATLQTTDAAAAMWVEEQQRQQQQLIRLYESTLDRQQTAIRLNNKFLAQIGSHKETIGWGQRLGQVWKVVIQVWNYEITSVNDNPITVKKIVIGLVLLVMGTWVAKTVSRVFAQRFLPRFGLTEGARAAIQAILFYALLVTVAMLSLRIVNVPLTAFTILGGALAIGVGFGSQNIVNNFISGLILLAERPIRVGDLVEIEDLIGTVSHIGPRSTRVRAPQNMDIVVPNSAFLEKNVVNWTLSDDRFRAHITVGVVYGSPTREVARLIRHALDEHGKVHAKPEPIILFADFGDNALIFEVHFWLRMRRIMERRIIESDLRFRIDTLFREAGIVIAFPQRDIHLDSVRPIDIRLLRETPGDHPTSTE